ncbi:hypothetical protein NPX13_g4964 [Xylaria arbuscula]|uniref:Uncharacterized protein n=1 Tax=Xylaria arbuscula TaxID=114810 RepID=A0A9W8NFB7_9PEZI|nr:hypothetical protein NPX13_g4964 [Xylaria arbuscula]
MATIDRSEKVAWHITRPPMPPRHLVEPYLLTRFDKNKPIDDTSHADDLIDFLDLLLSVKGIEVLFTSSVDVNEKFKQWAPLVRAAENGSLAAWGRSPEGALALILLLTVVPRKIYFNIPFLLVQLEAQALGLAVDFILSGVYGPCPIQWKMFFYYPCILQETLRQLPVGPIERMAARSKTRSRHRISVKEVADAIIRHAKDFCGFRRYRELE